nr:MFS transporter [Clostridium sp. MCC353]
MLTCNTCATQLSKTSINVYGKSLGATVAVLGFIATLNSWGKICCRPFSGRGVDKFNPRIWMITCSLLRMACYLCFALFDSVAMFGAARFLEGVTNALMVTSLYSLTGLCVTKAQISTAMALYSFIPALFSAGTTAFSTRVYEMGQKVPFYGSVGLLGIMCILSFFLKMSPQNEKKKEQGSEEQQKEKTSKKGFKITNYIALEGLWFLPMMWANSAHLAAEDLLIVVYATEMGYPAAGALYFSVAMLVKMWAVLPMGAMADRIGAKYVIYFGFLCKAVGFILLAMYPTALMFTVAGVLKGFGMPMQNIMQAQAVKVMPKSKMGIANSTHLLLTDFGVMFMSSAAGFICAAVGFSKAFMVFGALAACGAVCYAVMKGKIEGMVEKAIAEDEQAA